MFKNPKKMCKIVKIYLKGVELRIGLKRLKFGLIPNSSPNLKIGRIRVDKETVSNLKTPPPPLSSYSALPPPPG